MSGGCGLFGDLFMALNGVRFAERKRLSGEVCWDKRSLYFEAAKGRNVWSYYFENSAFAFGGEISLSGMALPYFPGAQDFDPYPGLSVRQSVHRLLQKHCRPRASILKSVEQFASERFSSEAMLGVHIRRTDAARGMEDRREVHLRHFVAEIDEWLRHHPGGAIFLATDEASVVEELETRYGERVIAQHCLRSRDGASLHGHYDGGTEGTAFRKGLEVIIDALLLARCDHLIRTHSRVTCYTLCLNPQLSYTDLDLKCLGASRTPWLHQ